jgi:hypothetical protein
MRIFGKNVLMGPKYHNQDRPGEVKKGKGFIHWFSPNRSEQLWEDLEWMLLGIFFLYFMYVLYLLFIPEKFGY